MAPFSLLTARSSAAILFFLTALIGACSVKCLAHATGKWVQLTNSLAGGVLIGVALCHMLADSIEDLEGWGRHVNGFLGGDSSEPFPLGFFACGVGFFLIVTLEHLLGGHDHRSEHLHDHAASGPSPGPSVESLEEASSAATSSSGNVSPEARPEDGVVIFARKTNTKLGGVGTFMGITIHSFIEGVAAGSIPKVDGLLVLLAAVLPHKFMAAFAVGSSLDAISGQPLWWILVIAMAASGPVGLLAGAATSSSLRGPGSALLQSAAAGTLLAVGIIELLMPALGDKETWRRRKLVAAVLAFCGMALIAVWA